MWAATLDRIASINVAGDFLLSIAVDANMITKQQTKAGRGALRINNFKHIGNIKIQKTQILFYIC